MEKVVLASFIHDTEYNQTVIPHIQAEYFEDEANKILIECALEYSNTHKKVPPKIVLETILDSRISIPEVIYQKAKASIEQIYLDTTKSEVSEATIEWKLGETLKWFKERAAYNTILISLDIIDGKYKENGVVVDKSAIPELMQKAISISFDTSIGHNYFADSELRFDFMHTKLNKIPFKIPIFNKITGGGLERGTLNLLLCPPHGGKTLTMGSLAVDWLALGYNVLAITLEMAEMKIGERIDAKTLNVEIDQLKNVPKKTYLSKLKSLADEKGYGGLIVKQYPTSSAGANHFRFLLNELEHKQGFIPDIVVIDYLGICTSTRFKKSDNMYQIQKSVGEEVRGLAVEKDFACLSAVQTNKNGMGSSDFDMTDISESSGHAMTADFMLGLISTPELVALGQVRCKQLKNRYGSIHEFETFLLNMDRKKMMVYEDSDFTRNHKVEEPEHKKPDSILPVKSRYDNLKTLN
jgi:hypothetical protein